MIGCHGVGNSNMHFSFGGWWIWAVFPRLVCCGRSFCKAGEVVAPKKWDVGSRECTSNKEMGAVWQPMAGIPWKFLCGFLECYNLWHELGFWNGIGSHSPTQISGFMMWVAGVLAPLDQDQRTTRGHPSLSWGLYAESVSPRISDFLMTWSERILEWSVFF